MWFWLNRKRPAAVSQLRHADPYGAALAEPALDEVMADPIVRLVMRRDGLTENDVRGVLRTARGR